MPGYSNFIEEGLLVTENCVRVLVPRSSSHHVKGSPFQQVITYQTALLLVHQSEHGIREEGDASNDIATESNGIDVWSNLPLSREVQYVDVRQRLVPAAEYESSCPADRCLVLLVPL